MSIRSALMVAGAAAFLALSPAAHAESLMKQCAAKWKAAKAAGTTQGMTYLQFSSKCRAELKAKPAAAAPAAEPAKHAAPAPAGSPVFPTKVNPAYAKESAGKARMHTCLDQYKANKATGGNAGLKWIQKGGGYYSECNKKLK